MVLRIAKVNLDVGCEHHSSTPPFVSILLIRRAFVSGKVSKTCPKCYIVNERYQGIDLSQRRHVHR